jgi:hypothetical protein
VRTLVSKVILLLKEELLHLKALKIALNMKKSLTDFKKNNPGKGVIFYAKSPKFRS